ncbi:MAG TPA: glycosyltransferase family 4 protein [Planctomycetota bacterium]|nr:glycosyltransferase family 4 protein [Planctomycetota bacterium]
MTIAFQIASDLGAAGLGRVALEAIRGIRDAGMLGTVTCLRRDRSPSHAGIVSEINEIRLLERFLPRRVATRLGFDSLMRQNYFGLRAALNLSECDVVHGFTGQMTETIRAARRRDIRTIVDRPNTHVSFIRRVMETEYRKYGVQFAPYTRSQVRRETRELLVCDAVVTCSRFAKQTMMDEGVDPARIHVIHYGVDLDAFKPAAKPDSVFRVVFAGLICLRKGVQYLLEAWEKLRLPHAELVMQGRVLDDAAALIRHYRSRCDFTLLPHTDDPRELCRTYNSASVCVFPSLEDGFGMVVAEAMACNRPVIVTWSMGAADMVADGADGMIIPAGDARAVGDALLAFYENPSLCRVRDARSRVAPLTWDAYRASLLRLYGSLVSGARGDTG